METIAYNGRVWDVVKTEVQMPVAYLDDQGTTVKRDPALTVLYLRESVPFTWGGFEAGEFAALVEPDEVGEFLALCEDHGIGYAFKAADAEFPRGTAFMHRDGCLRFGRPGIFKNKGVPVARWRR